MNAVFWFRRDLRLNDNTALAKALSGDCKVIPLFIFDTNILDELPENDSRVTFIYRQLQKINDKLAGFNSGLLIKHGKPLDIWQEIVRQYPVKEVYFNKDYEPYALQRDEQIKSFLAGHNISVSSFKDQVIFEENEVLKPNGACYTVFTPYKNKWLQTLEIKGFASPLKAEWNNLEKKSFHFPALENLGFSESSVAIKDINLSVFENYGNL
ncbi:MAG: deoxyribodipyrimidine photo-lyase [Draconibacterium sp.]